MTPSVIAEILGRCGLVLAAVATLAAAPAGPAAGNLVIIALVGVFVWLLALTFVVFLSVFENPDSAICRNGGVCEENGGRCTGPLTTEERMVSLCARTCRSHAAGSVTAGPSSAGEITRSRSCLLTPWWSNMGAASRAGQIGSASIAAGRTVGFGSSTGLCPGRCSSGGGEAKPGSVEVVIKRPCTLVRLGRAFRPLFSGGFK